MAGKRQNKKYYFYVLLCADGSLYGGFTTDLNKRLTAHNSGHGAKYTRVKSRRPVQMIHYEVFEEKGQALQAEYAFKHQPRAKKIAYLNRCGVADLIPEHLTRHEKG
ncbi:endonuclease [Liquorilactobacillus sucicola DSM 21376 = JCM 15457]|nr:GIY-YIG nuclease family protein [Liquorilactobacillus sucicola]GAJ25436.1 endonuclease [Liquorilactobacillus sucicola DSM 21376 = JCM 15457]